MDNDGIDIEVSLTVRGGSTVTLERLQRFINRAKELGVDFEKELSTEIKAPYHYDQRDSSPGSFTITAKP